MLSYLQASQLPDPLIIHPLLNLQGWDRKPYASQWGNVMSKTLKLMLFLQNISP